MKKHSGGNEKGRFILDAKRYTEKEWSTWTNTDDLETLINNIRTIENHGWQWRLRQPYESAV